MSRNKISWWSCIALIISSMVGTGVYTSLGFQLVSIPSGFVIVLLWTVGGILALFGALSYAELGCMFPRSGGEYNLLGRIYHPAVGFAAGVISATVAFAAPVALAAIAFGKYFAAVFPAVPMELSGGLALITMTSVHLRTINTGSRFQRLITLLNVLLILSFLATAFLRTGSQQIEMLPVPGDAKYMLSSSFAVSLMYVMYAYSGWNAPIYIGDEIRDVRTILSSALAAGTVIVMALYVGLNSAFLWSTPVSAMQGQVEVANIAGDFIFGHEGTKIASGLICVGLLGCISSMMWVGPRVLQIMGEDIHQLRFFSVVTEEGIPLRAILTQLVIAGAMFVTAAFERVLMFAQSAMLISSLLCVAGVIVLRVKEPDIERPFHCPGYPLTPLLFIGINLFAIYYVMLEKPLEAGLGAGVFLLSAVFFFIMNRGQKMEERQASG